MKTTLRKELPSLILVVLPFLYLAYIWNTLPEKVPMHWNVNGEIDGWGEKVQLLLIPFVLPVLVYVIFLFVPRMDPKKKIEKMGNKYHQLKFVMVLFMSALAVLLVTQLVINLLTVLLICSLLLGFFLLCWVIILRL